MSTQLPPASNHHRPQYQPPHPSHAIYHGRRYTYNPKPEINIITPEPIYYSGSSGYSRTGCLIQNSRDAAILLIVLLALSIIVISASLSL